MRRLLLFPLLAVAHAAAADTISGKVVAVANGDTLTMVDGAAKRHRIRLAEIDAPERKQAFGAESRKSLAEICLQKAAVAETVVKDRRLIGKVSCAGVDAGTEQVRRGMAWVFAGTVLPNSPLPEMEANARLRALGLWAGDQPEPPWEWRKRQGAPAAKK
ncbi:MAG TPA: thermonuclease family protein [Burkholderiales bacterium]|nr:thermonuclease family protein [Burkholderiales bacterium]